MNDQDDKEVAVEATSEDIDMEAQIEELRDILADVDPDNVCAIGCVVQFKQSIETADGDEANGQVWRVLNNSLDGYQDTSEVMSSVVSFNDALDDIKLPTTAPPSPPKPPEGVVEAFQDIFGG